MIDPGTIFLFGLIWGVFGTLSFRAAFCEYRSSERSKRGARHPLKDVSAPSVGD